MSATRTSAAIHSKEDIRWMQRAIELARCGMNTTTPNPRVGCVIVSPTGELISEGYHKRAGGPHAEIEALQIAGQRAKGATVYVSLEPCSHQGRTGPCAQALAAGVGGVGTSGCRGSCPGLVGAVEST